MKLPVEELAALAVVDLVLHQRLADALHHATHLLAAHDHRIDDAAEVVDHVVAVDATAPVSGSTSSSTTWAPFGWLGGVGSKLPVESRPMPNLSVIGPIGA